MSLRAQAKADLKSFLENDNEFGWPVVVTAPDSTTLNLIGYSNDIGLAIDPETGQAVAGRAASVTFHLSRFTDAGFDPPSGVTSTIEKPWIVAFEDSEGVSRTFKVAQGMPDRAAGVVVCILELYVS